MTTPTPRRLATTALLVAAVAALTAVPAAASTPDRFTAADHEESSFSVDCGDFVAQGHGTLDDRFTMFIDADGQVDRFTEHVSAPADVWSNPSTGRSVTIRAHFTQVHRRIPGTDEFDRTVTGFRYLVDVPGSGAVVKDVGRVVYDDLEETSWSFLAGRHDWVDQARIEPGICDLLR